MRSARARDDGQITLLIIGFVMIVVLAVGVVANASKAFLYRRSLASWADGAAITAAQSVAEDAVYAGPAVDQLPLSAPEARRVVDDYVARHGLAARFDHLRVGVQVSAGGATVTVQLTALVPFVLAERAGGIDVTAHATATAPLE
ncbi:MAG: hypothetical protein ICV70_03260 [Jiangellaceae bacterium]|nr:hypothetical protein [Jiangellaceae bacterium]